MIQSIQVHLITVAMQWQPVLTSLRLVGVFVGLLAGVQYQGSSDAYPATASSHEAPALIERLKAIEAEDVLMVIGEALVLFGK